MFSVPSPIEEIFYEPASSRGVKLFVKRDDLIHPLLGGNKYRKLKYNFEEAKNLGIHRLLTFGGAYSNHLFAVASTGKLLNFETIGIIRGEEHFPLNPTLSHCVDCGMKLIYVTREKYREKYTSAFKKWLEGEFGTFYYIPEGGTNELAIKGTSEILKEIEPPTFDYIFSAVGTGGTLAGLINSAAKPSKVYGVSALKNGSFLYSEVEKWLRNDTNDDNKNWEILTDYHFGGYAKFDHKLLSFLRNFYSLTNIKLDPVYTGKAFFAALHQIEEGFVEEGSSILLYHSGGLQGIEGFEKRHKLQIY